MHWSIVPAEYELPEEVECSRKRRWLPMLVTLAIILGATLALVASDETFSSVAVPVDQ
jgi:hypothetical protein